MACKISGSGLKLKHLQIAFGRNGKQGIEELFGEKVEGKSRVTRDKKVVGKICMYLEKVSC